MANGIVIVSAVAGLTAGCTSIDRGHTPDAARAADAAEARDAAACMPVMDAAAAQSCLALGAARFQGATPLGDVDAALVYFGAGDCLSHASANIEWLDACGERVRLQFPYPVTADGTKRHVTGNFDTSALFEVQSWGAAPRDRTTSIHVDVVTWQEGDGVHTIDIAVTVTDPAFQLDTLHVQGTFCDWPFYLC